MPRRAGPSVRSRRIAFELRKLRIGSGHSCAELGKLIDMSASKISRFETGDGGIYRDDVEKLIDFFQPPIPKRVFLLELARHSEQRGWLRVDGAKFAHDWQTWIELESEASALFNYEPLVLPGLLQTAEYAAAVIRMTGSQLADDRVDLMVASRMSRQSLLTRTRPMKLSVIIEEDVLARPIGDDAAFGRQLRHLADMAARPNVSVRVIFREAGLHVGLSGPFVILDYDDEASLVLLENKVSNLFLDEQEHIDSYTNSWEALEALALDEEGSIDLIRSAAQKIHNL